MGDLFLKDPAATLEYRIDWGGTLAEGQSIVASSWAVEPVEAGGLVPAEDTVAEGTTSVRLAEGVLGHVYRISNRVAFSDGLLDERSLVLRVEER